MMEAMVTIIDTKEPVLTAVPGYPVGPTGPRGPEAQSTQQQFTLVLLCL